MFFSRRCPAAKVADVGKVDIGNDPFVILRYFRDDIAFILCGKFL